ncbi:cobalamin B12-binding domain-containing protein [Micromonospora yangpuensis]|uniref:Methanogenic corrinoid protein MtbC1 n=1 Tax=Micromonospora yangpuensis TaxID=683228 RepID=A0A1C6V684_9ACTN|nr:cobalamin-dependent protein [Micromonospora yangpuensis]GGM19129.1 cobalamin-binding protein [Micromonospora yangpuensis]SCL61871.1 Methanogenic corrinoid protein MtbC1 [Micromonospora yangpuensis]
MSDAVVRAYLDCLERVDAPAAVRLVAGLLDAGWSVADVLVDVVALGQREIGRRWLTGQWSVAEEHAATHVSELVVAAVAARTSVPPKAGHAVVACVEGEWHALAARIVAEVVRAEGWRVTFLGASVPARHLVSYLHQSGPDAVLLSCVQPNRLIRAARMIEACRSAGMPVIAGGPGFGPDGRWATAVGATAWGGSARDAARLLVRHGHPGFGAGPVPPPGADEYVAVLRRRREVVQLTVRTVDPPEDRAEEVANAVAHLVDALAAAIRVDDPQLLVDFVTWQDAALAGRGDKRPLLDTVLTSCATVLAEHPQARHYLRLTRAAVARSG